MRTLKAVPVAACCLGATCLVASAPATATPLDDAAPPPAAEQGPYYVTNPGDQVGEAADIVVDGDASEWSPQAVVAQGVANDDPRIFRGSHEGPVYDLYSLSAAWDDANLYLMWQITNVTDVVDPGQTYPVSDNGKPYAGDIPMSVALDVDPEVAADGLVDGTKKGVWGIKSTYAPTQGVDRLVMFSAKPGVGKPSLFLPNASGSFDYEEENVLGFAKAGIELEHADGLVTEGVLGIDDNGGSGYAPEDLLDEDLYEDLAAAGHDAAQDTTYEMKIPLKALGTTSDALTTDGIGVLLTATFGESAIGSLPQDPVVLDHATEPYSADTSTSAEKEDADAFSVPLARIGHE
ncbi:MULTISPECIES: hypothetical protein [unclassified Isoptericola]|uniref:hypothetical protein n=1 Tax=unclassified Isoptericola TaxID=2623355 RepID=UPI0036626802